MTAEHIDQDGSIIVKMTLSLVHRFGGTVVVGHLCATKSDTNRRAFFCWVCCPLCGRDYCVEGTAPFRHTLLLTINIVAVSGFVLIEQQQILFRIWSMTSVTGFFRTTSWFSGSFIENDSFGQIVISVIEMPFSGYASNTENCFACVHEQGAWCVLLFLEIII